MSGPVNLDTLGWVRSEIDQTLAQARDELSDPALGADAHALRYFVNHVHQVVGTLQMVELDGAAQLAQETERLALHIGASDSSENGELDAGRELLERALTHLSEYMDKLAAGMPDAPLRNIGILNQLRSARRAEAVEPYALFHPNLETLPPRELSTPDFEPSQYRSKVASLRRTYQAALLGWLRDSGNSDALEDIFGVINELYRISRFHSAARVWWVARAYIKVLNQAELRRDDPRKHVLATLDQKMRTLIEEAEAALAREGSNDLLRFMLYEISVSEVHHQHVDDVRIAFHLDAMGGKEEIPVQINTESGFPHVLSELKEPVSVLAEVVEGFGEANLEAKQRERGESSLDRITSSADSAGLGEVSRLAGELRQVLFSDHGGPDEGQLLEAAKTILFLQQALDSGGDDEGAWRQEINLATHRLHTAVSGQSSPVGPLPDSQWDMDGAEFNRLAASVSAEIDRDLELAEASLEQFAQGGAGDFSELEAVSQSLHRVRGAVQILNQHPLSDLLDSALVHLRSAISNEAMSLSMLDALAVVVGTAQVYVSGLDRSQSELENLVDRALSELQSAASEETGSDPDPLQSVKEIEESLETWISDNADYRAFRIIRRNLRHISTLARREDKSDLLNIVQEMGNLLDIVTDNPVLLTGEIESTLRETLSILGESVAGLRSADATTEAQVDEAEESVDEAEESFEDVEESVDESRTDAAATEMHDIFEDEAQQCLSQIESLLDGLENSDGSESDLTEIKRHFHSLKGSGRMVGAGDFAELSWIAEQASDRFVSANRPASFELIEFLRDAWRSMTSLLSGSLEDGVDLALWAERGRNIELDGQASDGGDAHLQEPFVEEIRGDGILVESVGAIPEDTAVTKPRITIPEDIDEGPVIRIFTDEARGHMGTIRDFIDAHRRSGSASISDEVLRAVHTLQGGARSLHLVEVSHAYAALDRVLHVNVSTGSGLSHGETDLIDRLLEVTDKVLEYLNRDRRFPEIVRQELNSIAEQLDALDPTADAGFAGLDLISEITGETESPFREIHSDAHPIPADLGFFSGDPTSESISFGGEWSIDSPETPLTVESQESVGEPEAIPFEDDDFQVPLSEARQPAAPVSEEEQAAATVSDEEQPVTPVSEVAQPTAPADPAEDVTTGVSRDLSDVFRDEAVDTLSRCQEALTRWRNHGADDALLGPLRRELHTLKGSAQTAGFEVIGELSHDTETLLAALPAQVHSGSEDVLNLLEEVHDTIADMVAGAAEKDTDENIRPLLDRLRAETERIRDLNKISEEQLAEDKPDPSLKIQSQPPMVSGPLVSEPEQAAETRPDTKTREARMVRIRSNVLDNLVDYAGEVSISRSQISRQLGGLKGNLAELRTNVSRFAEQLRELDIQADSQIRSRAVEAEASDRSHGFDPLELDRYTQLQQLSRGLSESLDELLGIQDGLNQFAYSTENVLSQQASLNAELQEGLMSARMVPFRVVVPRLRHHVRQVARELHKEVELEVEGETVEVDKNVIDQLVEALEHMIRNAIDHGIESAEERGKLDKPPRGGINIQCRLDGRELAVRFSDDGSGFDVDKIRDRAVEAGLLAEDAEISDQDIGQIIVTPGFTTAESVTRLSGRGVGLDVVHDAVRRLGGSFQVENQVGQGAIFRFRVPISLSITQALFVQCGGHTFAVSLGVIDRVVKAGEDAISESKDGDLQFNIDGETYPLMDLAPSLGLTAQRDESANQSILLVRMGTRDVAVRVDDLFTTHEIVVKPLGSHLGELPGLGGATVTGDGGVVLILDLADLWLAEQQTPLTLPVPETEAVAPTVMVIDDSLTVRKITGRDLSRNGMKVIMARDGLDAMEKLEDHKPDLMLVDIEMPRMDGYELTAKVRADPDLADIPIVVITSRAGERHRQKARELGANAYLTKPYQERELLEQVNEFLPRL